MSSQSELEAENLALKAEIKAQKRVSTELKYRLAFEQSATERQQQNIFSIIPSLNCIAGLDGYFKHLSPRFEDLLGYPLAELMSLPFLSFVHPEDQASTQTEIERLTVGCTTIGFENRYRCQNGSYLWLSWHGTADLQAGTIYATAIDITERKQEQLELTQQNGGLQLLANLILQIRQYREIEAVFQQTAESLQVFLNTDRVLILKLTPEGGLVMAASGLNSFLNLNGATFLNSCFGTDPLKRYQDRTHSMIVDVSQADIQDCHREFLESLNVKSNVVTPLFLQEEVWGLLAVHQCDALRIWTNLEVDLLKQVADQLSVGIAQWQLLNQLEDLVQERTLALLRSQTQFRSLFEAAPDLIYILNTLGVIQTINPAVVDNLGFSQDELIQYPFHHVLSPSSQTSYQAEFKTLLNKGFARQEMILQCKDGSQITVDCSFTVVSHDEDPFILVLQRDISKQKVIDAMKNEFVSVVSHELRTPLTSIHGSLKLLGTGNLGTLSSQGEQVLDIALRNTNRLSRLINDVLDLERIESGKVVMSKQHCQVTELMMQATQDMQAMATQYQVTLVTTELNLDIYADPDHLLQTLTNLLSNAIKFSSPHGRIWLSAREHNQDVLFEVRDQGRGIPNDKLDQIFDRFQQVDVSDSRRMGGTGLGLSICRQIVERHGGRIWAKSYEGVGSSFYFTLPILKDVNSVPI